MAIFKANYSSPQTKVPVVDGVVGKIILVTRVCFTSVGSGSVRLWSDPQGASEEAMSPPLRNLSSSTMHLTLGRRYGLTTERGKSLGLSTESSGPNMTNGIIVWYELVD